MSVITPTIPPLVAPPPPASNGSIFRLSVSQYHEMIRTGILTADDPVELLEGLLVTKMPKKPPHRGATYKVKKALERIVPPGWYVDSQEPITTEDSEPEPDGMVVRGESDQYLDRHPGPLDLGLLVKVADTSLEKVRTFKKGLYARARIPVYWIVNLLDCKVEVYTGPTGPAETPDYRQHRDNWVEDHVPLILDGKEIGRIPVQDLLP